MGQSVSTNHHTVQNLVNSWIPSLDGGKVEEKLKKGGASSMSCVPASLASNGPALGAQAEVVKASGFMHFKRATQTPVNLVYEAKA
jgi:hypothetical protein